MSDKFFASIDFPNNIEDLRVSHLVSILKYEQLKKKEKIVAGLRYHIAKKKSRDLLQKSILLNRHERPLQTVPIPFQSYENYVDFLLHFRLRTPDIWKETHRFDF